MFAGSALGKKGEQVARDSRHQVWSAAPGTPDSDPCLRVSGVYADKIGIEAAEMLLRNLRHNNCVDEFLQDQVGAPARPPYDPFMYSSYKGL